MDPPQQAGGPLLDKRESFDATEGAPSNYLNINYIFNIIYFLIFNNKNIFLYNKKILLLFVAPLRFVLYYAIERKKK